MNAKEIAEYACKWWNNRKELDNAMVYKAHVEKTTWWCLKRRYISYKCVVDTPWGMIHTAVSAYDDGNVVRVSHFDPMQYSYSAYNKTSTAPMDKREYYNLYKKHQRKLEHSCVI